MLWWVYKTFWIVVHESVQTEMNGERRLKADVLA